MGEVRRVWGEVVNTQTFKVLVIGCLMAIAAAVAFDIQYRRTEIRAIRDTQQMKALVSCEEPQVFKTSIDQLK